MLIGLLLLVLYACSSDDNSSLWTSPQVLVSTSDITLSKSSTNNNGDVVVIWQQTEQDERVDQATQDAHDASIPYAETDPISAARTITLDDGTAVLYDNTNLEHRTIAKQFDYADHSTHSHVDLYTRTNILAKTFSASSSTWSADVTLQTGFWIKNQSAERIDVKNPEQQLKITDNFAERHNSHLISAKNDSGDAIAAWIQFVESSDASGEASSSYEILVSHFSKSANTWSEIERVAFANVLKVEDLSVSLADDGSSQLLWLARDVTANRTNLYASTYDATGKTWSSESLVSDGLTDVSLAPKLTMFDAQSGVVIWGQINPAASANGLESQINLYANWYNASGWFTTPALVSDGLGDVSDYGISTNNQGGVWAYWVQNKASSASDSNSIRQTFAAWVSQFNGDISADLNNGAWTNRSTIQGDDSATAEDDSLQTPSQLSLAVDGAGNVIATWIQALALDTADSKNTIWNNATRHNVWFNIYKISHASTDGDGNSIAVDEWLGAKLLDENSQFSNAMPVVIATSNNQFSIVWKRWTSSSQQSGDTLFSKDYDVSTETLSTVTAVNATSDNIRHIHLSTSGSQSTRIVWVSENTALQQASK